MGHVRAYAYSAIITAGPFALMAGMVLSIQMMFYHFYVDYDSTQLFLGVVVYSFVFSQLFSSGCINVLTRYVADCLSVHDYKNVSASLFGMWSLVAIFSGGLSVLFFIGKPIDFSVKLLGVLLFVQLFMLWVENVYLSALKEFRRLIFSYLVGIFSGLVVGAAFFYYSVFDAVQTALLAMNIGIAIILFLFLVQIVHHFGLPRDGMHFAFLPYFEIHWRLCVTMYSLIAGLYVPNFLVWLSPWGTVVAGTFHFAPVYDILTFYAFLSIMPLLTMFVVSAETSFYDRYREYFYLITQKGNFREIENAKKSLIHVLWAELRHMIEFQFVFTMVFLAGGTYILSWSGITYSQVNMYNVLLMAAFFTGLLQVISILMVYFDIQEEVLKIAGIFLAANLVFGVICIFLLGESSFGLNFLLGSGIALGFCMTRLSYFCDNINYYVFCAQPVFYRPPNGFFTRFVKWLYGVKYQDLLQGEHES